MILQTEKYETLHLTEEELSVISAFFKINCLYGVSKSWMKVGHEDLRSKVIRVVHRIENLGYILIRPDGTVEVNDNVYSVFKKMADCTKMAKVISGEKRISEIHYFYFGDGAVVTLRPDNRGGYFLGEISSLKDLQNCMTDATNEENENKYFGVLAMQKYENLYKTEIDISSYDTKSTNKLDLWEKICYFLLETES